MGIIIELEQMIEHNTLIQWIIVSSVASFVFSILDILVISQIFNVNLSKKKIIITSLINGIFRIIFTFLLKAPHNRIANIIISILIYKFILNQTIEKSILVEVINFAIILATELFFSKLFITFLQNVETYQTGAYNYIYKSCLTIAISLARFAIYYILKIKNITIELSDHLNKKNKYSLVIMLIIGTAVILFNEIIFNRYVTNLPYSVFLMNVSLLTLCMFISIRTIIKISIIEEQNAKINNLESYNKTLSIMYDSIRGFRHDYANFIQALSGYVEANDIDGIRIMSKAIMKECMKVNNMGILDPKIIDNPSVYSIITNKYYAAEREKISMNLEIMTDFKDVKRYSYEFCKILGILLDNAIEASKECSEKTVNIRFIKDSKANKKLLVIENSYENKEINLDKIYEKGYTTKEKPGDKHGLGLWNVKRILNQTEKLSLYTSKGQYFKQQLEIFE